MDTELENWQQPVMLNFETNQYNYYSEVILHVIKIQHF